MSQLSVALRRVNPEQLASLLRAVLQLAGGALMTHGVFDSASWETLSGGLMAIAVALWGMQARSDKNLLVSAAGVPTVQTITTSSPMVAASVRSDKVVHAGHVTAP